MGMLNQPVMVGPCSKVSVMSVSPMCPVKDLVAVRSAIYIIRGGCSHRPYQDSRVVFVVAGTHGLLGSVMEVSSCDWSVCAAACSGDAPLWRVPGQWISLVGKGP